MNRKFTLAIASLLIFAVGIVVQGNTQSTPPKDEKQPKGLGTKKAGAAASPMQFIEYKNSHYMQPPVGAGDGGHMIRIPLTVPVGTVDRAEVYHVEGGGCGWTHQCPDGAACPDPYRHPFDITGSTATWNAWSNSGQNCAVFFNVYYH